MNGHATATLSNTRFVIRPTVALYLRRLLQSNEGKFVLFVSAIAVGFGFGESPVHGGAAVAVLVSLFVLVLSRTKIEVTPGRLVIGNGLRVHDVPLAELAGLTVQPVVYKYNGFATHTKFRLMAVVSNNGSEPRALAAFASERRKPEMIDEMIGDIVAAIRVHAA